MGSVPKNHATGALKADFFLTKGDEFLFQRFPHRCYHPLPSVPQRRRGSPPICHSAMATTAANDTRGCLVMTFSTSTDEMFFAAGDNNVFSAVFDLQILVGVHDRQVAGLKPLTGKKYFQSPAGFSDNRSSACCRA